MKKILEYLFVIFLILSCNTIYTASVGINYRINELLILVSILLLFVHIISTNFNRKKIVYTFIALIFYYLYILIFLLLNNTPYKTNFIYLFGILFPVFYIYYNTSKENNNTKNFIEIYPKIITVIAVISLIFYVFGTCLNIIPSTGKVTIEWGVYKTIPSYFNLYFTTQVTNLFGINLIRNSGIFTEVPMYSLCLTIALTLEMFLTKEKSRFRIFVLIITIITTYSTTGIVIALLMLLIAFFKNKKNSKRKKYLKLFILPIVVLLVGGITLYLYNNKVDTSSYSARLDDYYAIFLSWKDSLFIGNGYRDSSYIQEYMSNFRIRNTGLSNSLVVLSQCGIYLFILYLIPLIKSIIYSVKTKKYNILIFCIVMVILFITTIFPYKEILLNILAIGLALPKREEIKDEI